MRLVKILSIVLCILALSSMVIAGPKNSMGIREVGHVTFCRASTSRNAEVLPAGEYVVRHTMEGQDHIMVFQLAPRKEYGESEMHAGSAGRRRQNEIRSFTS